MKAGILFGPCSGDGKAASAEAALARWLRGNEAAVCRGSFAGTGTVREWTVVEPAHAHGYVEELREAVAALAGWGAGLLVCVGGDGLASYAADAAARLPERMALLGIAAGTVNVGPIVSAGIEELAGLDPGRLSAEKLGAVEVLAGGRHVAWGFNDVVIGNSFLGTLGGRTASLSAKALLAGGEKRAIVPSPFITGPGFFVEKNGTRLDPGCLGSPAQIVVSPLGKREFFARAIAGALCNAPYMKSPAALALFDSVIVKAGPPDRGFDSFSTSKQLLFVEGDSVVVGGLAEDGQIVVDGNPYGRVGDSVTFRMVPGVVDVAGKFRREMEDGNGSDRG